MNIIYNFLENFFDDKKSILIIFLLCLFVILISQNVYIYEARLSLQDASDYIALAEDPKKYFTLSHQGALRILPSFLVFTVKKFGFSTDIAFKALTYLFFFLLHLKIFYLLKAYKIKNFLALSSIGILFYSNHSVIYSVFNFYQLVDLITYMLIIIFIEIVRIYSPKKLFIISLCAIFTKEFLLVLVLTTHILYFFKFEKKSSLVSLSIIIIFFFIHYYFASSSVETVKESSNIIFMTKSFLLDYKLFIYSMHKCLILENNVYLFFPFIFLLLSKKFIKFLLEYLPIIIFTLIPITFSIFLFHIVGNNFFRIFYHGYFVFVLLSIIFLIEKISNNKKLSIIFFISPLFFVIDYLYILLNIKQDGFFKFFQFTRYDYFSGYFIFNILILSIILIQSKNIYLNNNHKKLS